MYYCFTYITENIWKIKLKFSALTSLMISEYFLHFIIFISKGNDSNSNNNINFIYLIFLTRERMCDCSLFDKDGLFIYQK